MSDNETSTRMYDRTTITLNGCMWLFLLLIFIFNISMNNKQVLWVEILDRSIDRLDLIYFIEKKIKTNAREEEEKRNNMTSSSIDINAYVKDFVFVSDVLFIVKLNLLIGPKKIVFVDRFSMK